VIPNSAKATLSALLLCLTSNTAGGATLIRSEEFVPYVCGAGGTIEIISLPSKTAQFGIAQTSSAVSVTTIANTNAEAGYDARISLTGYSRGGIDSDLREVRIYFKPAEGFPENILLTTVNFTAKGRGSQRYQRVDAQARFSDLSASSTGVGGWRFVRIFLGSKPFDVGELRLRVFLQNDLEHGAGVKFGKIELLSSNEVLRDNRSVLILKPLNCNSF